MEISQRTADRLEEGYILLEPYLLGVANIPPEMKKRLRKKVREIRAILDVMYAEDAA